MSDTNIGYELDRCHFCGHGGAGYERAEDSKPSGPYFSACEECARKPYPQPERLKKENHHQDSAN